MEYFSYKDESGEHGYCMHIEAFKRRTGLDYI